MNIPWFSAASCRNKDNMMGLQSKIYLLIKDDMWVVLSLDKPATCVCVEASKALKNMRANAQYSKIPARSRPNSE